ncbi:nucleotidyl transferase AbiEii/AbiGii toxin family protein [Rhizobium sp. LjRoot98]|uniref:nucleotidyl transferase AbiEii/AbiGii toxin family protein n=1 Tax=Rhizobium sp. LjRoot98 TaxID=3342345 RepID=UPI003ECDF204
MSNNDEIISPGCRLIDRIRGAACYHGIDTRKATERMLCEEISRGLSKHLIPKHMVKGGLLWPQITRETGDLDILFERKIEPHEMCRALEAMKPDLAAKGIVLEAYSKTPKPLWIDGNGGDRYDIVAKAGRTRINTHLDVTGGTDLFPKFRPERRHGSIFFRDQVPLLGLYQSFESQAADKLAAVVLDPTTTRWKDFRDLSMLFAMKLDASLIGAELVHKLRRKIVSDDEIMALLPEAPEVFAYEFALDKAQVWEHWRDKNAKQMDDFTDVLCDGRHLYLDVRRAMATTLENRRERHKRAGHKPTVEEIRQLRVKAQRVIDQGQRVVRLGDYRPQEHSASRYRPKM